MHHGLTSSDVLDTALALQLSQAGVILVAGAQAYRDALVRARARARGHDLRRPHARDPGRADDVRRQARRASRSRPSGTCAACAARSSRPRSGALSGAVGTYAANGPELEEAVLARLGLAREDVSTQVVARDRHAQLLNAIALAGAGPRAVRHRGPPPPAHGGARGRGAVPRRPEGLVRDAAQAQPDRVRAHLRASRGCCAATRRSGSRTSRSGTSATSRTPRRSGSRCPTRASCSTTRSTWRSGWWRG